MGPIEVHRALTAKGVRTLYHANTVETSCSFLKASALLSRQAVEARGLHQSAQSSDAVDKRLGIWDRVFLDHVDIHARSRRRNFYGPVLFELDVDVLLGLSDESSVDVTKTNPVHWREGQSEDERRCGSMNEVLEGLTVGDFGQMLMIKALPPELRLPAGPIRVVLDNPMSAPNGHEYFLTAKQALASAAESGRVVLDMHERACSPECGCASDYASQWNLFKLFDQTVSF